MEEECEHDKLINYYIGNEIRAYKCQGCNKVLLVGADKFHSMEVFSEAIRCLQDKVMA